MHWARAELTCRSRERETRLPIRRFAVLAMALQARALARDRAALRGSRGLARSS
jgi:hypothetical protein